ncbi:MAG: acetyl/propionyl/methylcrotonyl-CoA carboxylase subunit alpha [Alphaproteobacteria bacterium]|nr:acetyl/propionyl/methylcrotonyl-CoA carboxylase subunit alpha [Alphaproteobacteria bacterium]
MFRKILIANRGEIACRVMRTARRMGIKTVAVYSDADRDALHVREADEAVRIGPAPSAESYLVAERIVQACRDTGAEAVHPGYGFLSERASFAEALAAAGMTFIGPPVGAIGAMGDKIESKKLAQGAGVSTVPGHLQALSSPDEAVEVAERIGYPVMLKASAGGGGKGMRVCRTAAEVREGLVSTMNEARSAFGDDRVFCEKFIEKPRHIEIQVLGDTHGTVLHLGERECSVQRRHQKVIEEAPSPFVDEAMRAAMGAQAVALAKAVGYYSAGTVEFIAGADKSFYFLEMNTRLQVEHPVTELVTGLDLVEWMIRVAAGEKLPFGQDQVKLKGWAMEARLYAEDPARNFLPSIGRVTRYQKPEGKGVRVDTGVYEGAEISMYYDPMIAKLITSGATRDAAIDTMASALDGFQVRGLNHNAEFLAALMALPRFRAGDLTTNLIAEEFPGGYAAATPSGDRLAELLALAAARAWGESKRAGPKAKPLATLVVRADSVNHPVKVQEADGGVDVLMDGWTLSVRGPLDPVSLWSGTINGRAMTVQIDRVKGGERLAHGAQAVVARVMRPRAAELMALMPVKQAADMSKFLLSPMPGLLVSVAVTVGQDVKAGEPLAVVEAMKMENVLRAERDGVVKAIRAEKGASLAVDQVILEFA